MTETMTVLLAQTTPTDGQPGSLFGGLLPMILLVGLFYVLLIHPMRSKQKKLESLVKTLKNGDRVIVNPGIFATIVSVENDAFVVRIDDKAKMKVLKSAVAGRQPSETDEQKEK